MDYNILEFPKPKNINWTITTNKSDSCKLENIINQYIINKQILEHSKWIGISLSGGVDSMVLVSLLIIIRNKYKCFNIIAIHINYNNRPETKDEENFIKEWCIKNQIELCIIPITEFKRGETEREKYEKETKNIRFNSYKLMIERYNLKGIFLAHHKGDEQENTFTNIMNGRNIFNISAMNDESEINKVNILRPLIHNLKSEIFEFAHKNFIPYFKDTTPEWSNRGKIRNEVFPLLHNIYSNKYLENLSNLSDESKEWNHFINEQFIKPFITKNIIFKENEVIISNYSEFKNYPIVFWNAILTKITRNFNIDSIKKKAIKVFYDKLKSNFEGECPLNKRIKCYFKKEKSIILKIITK